MSASAVTNPSSGSIYLEEHLDEFSTWNQRKALSQAVELCMKRLFKLKLKEDQQCCSMRMQFSQQAKLQPLSIRCKRIQAKGQKIKLFLVEVHSEEWRHAQILANQIFEKVLEKTYHKEGASNGCFTLLSPLRELAAQRDAKFISDEEYKEKAAAVYKQYPVDVPSLEALSKLKRKASKAQQAWDQLWKERHNWVEDLPKNLALRTLLLEKQRELLERFFCAKINHFSVQSEWRAISEHAIKALLFR